MTEPNKRHKISLKHGSTLEYKNNKWYRDNKLVNINNYKLYDNDGYWKNLTADGNLAVADVDDQRNPIKHKYIGGTTKEARDTYWKQAPIVRHAVDSIAKEYNISPKLLRKRLDEEGFTDESIRQNNANRDASSYNTLNSLYKPLNKADKERYNSQAFNMFGLDDGATMIKEGTVKLKNETWKESTNKNKFGRTVYTSDGTNMKSNIGIMGATLKAFQDKAQRDFPNASRQFLEDAATTYYTHGPYGGKTIMQKKKK